MRKVKQKKENKECIRRAGGFLFNFSFVEKKKEQTWKEAGRVWKDRVLRKVEVLEKVVKVNRDGLRPDSGRGNLSRLLKEKEERSSVE